MTGALDRAWDDHALVVEAAARSRGLVRHNIAPGADGLTDLADVLRVAVCLEVVIGCPDALLAAALFTDARQTKRARWYLLILDSRVTVALRRTYGARYVREPLAHRFGIGNQLRGHLKAMFRGAVTSLAGIGPASILASLTPFNSQELTHRASGARLAAWLVKIGHTGRTLPAVLHFQLTAQPHEAQNKKVIKNVTVPRARMNILSRLFDEIKPHTSVTE